MGWRRNAAVVVKSYTINMLMDTTKKAVFLFISFILFFHIIVSIFMCDKARYNSGIATMISEERVLVVNGAVKNILRNESAVITKIKGILSLFNSGSHRGLAGAVISSLFISFFGVKYSLFIINIILYLMLISGTYLLGRKLFNDRRAGLLSAYLVSLYPVFYCRMPISDIWDLPLAVFFIFAIYFLLCSDNFHNLRYSIISGLFSGFGVLFKASFLIFMVCPIAISIVCIIRNLIILTEKPYKQLINLFVFLLITTLISSLLWSGNITWMFSWVSLYIKSDYNIRLLLLTPFFVPLPPAGVIPGIFYNIAAFFSVFIKAASIFLSVLFIFASLFLLRTVYRKNTLLILLYFIFPMVILFSSVVKVTRYFMPLIPLMSVITAAWLLEVYKINKKKMFIILVCSIALFQFIFTPYWSNDYKYVDENRYRRGYGEFERASNAILNYVFKTNDTIPEIYFISEANEDKLFPFLALRYFMFKNCIYRSRMFVHQGDINKSDFIVLLLDRKFYFKLARLLELGRKNPNKAEIFDLCKENLLFITAPGRDFYQIMSDQAAFDSYVNNFIAALRDGQIALPLTIYEKLLIADAARKKFMLDDEAGKYDLDDLFLWPKAYNESGVGGLADNLAISYKEFKSSLKSKNDYEAIGKDPVLKALYEKIKKQQMSVVGSGELLSIGIDYYVFGRNQDK